MPDIDEQVTPPANPADTGNEPQITPENLSEPESANSSTEPSPEYKGLQRRLQREIDARKALEERLNDVTQQQSSGGFSEAEADALAMGLLQEVAKTDEDRARYLASQYLLYKNQRGTTAPQPQQQTQAPLAPATDESLATLRDLAADLGVDPDNMALDYGYDSESMGTRISKLRESVKELKAPVTPVTPRPVSVADGTAHNTQPGTPAQPRPEARDVTHEEVRAAIRKYATTRDINDLKRADELKAKLEAQGV